MSIYAYIGLYRLTGLQDDKVTFNNTDDVNHKRFCDDDIVN